MLELVPGPTLAERVAQGPIPLEEALPLLNQLIDALEYAHERGVVHRHLKPANLKITPEGKVKVARGFVERRSTWTWRRTASASSCAPRRRPRLARREPFP